MVARSAHQSRITQSSNNGHVIPTNESIIKESSIPTSKTNTVQVRAPIFNLFIFYMYSYGFRKESF